MHDVKIKWKTLLMNNKTIIKSTIISLGWKGQLEALEIIFLIVVFVCLKIFLGISQGVFFFYCIKNTFYIGHCVFWYSVLSDESHL